MLILRNHDWHTIFYPTYWIHCLSLRTFLLVLLELLIYWLEVLAKLRVRGTWSIWEISLFYHQLIHLLFYWLIIKVGVRHLIIIKHGGLTIRLKILFAIAFKINCSFRCIKCDRTCTRISIRLSERKTYVNV